MGTIRTDGAGAGLRPRRRVERRDFSFAAVRMGAFERQHYCCVFLLCPFLESSLRPMADNQSFSKLPSQLEGLQRSRMYFGIAAEADIYHAKLPSASNGLAVPSAATLSTYV